MLQDGHNSIQITQEGWAYAGGLVLSYSIVETCSFSYKGQLHCQFAVFYHKEFTAFSDCNVCLFLVSSSTPQSQIAIKLYLVMSLGLMSPELEVLTQQAENLTQFCIHVLYSS